jgi:flagellar M-ring protein FliF
MLRERWNGLTKSQKIKVSAIAGVVLVALVLTLILTLRTTWVPAFHNVDAATAAELQNVLQEEGIRARTNIRQGVVSVPAGDYDAAWTAALISPVMHQQRFNFDRAIEEAGMGVTSTMQHNMIMRARETEVENALLMMPRVTSVSVELNLPNAPMLIAPTSPATAAVTVIGNNLTPEDGAAIALITSRAVEGLDINNVSVIDAGNMNILFNDGEPQGWNQGTGSAVAAAEHAVQTSLESRGSRILADSFDQVTVVANARMDWTEVFLETWHHINPVADAEGDMAHRGLLTEEDRHLIRAWTQEVGLAIEPGVMPQDFPGGPLYGEDMPDFVLGMFDDRDISRYLYDTIHRIERNNPGSLVAENSSISVVTHRYLHHFRSDLITLGIIDDSDTAWLMYQNEMGGTAQFRSDGDYADFVGLVQGATGLENVQFVAWNHNFFHDMPPTAPLPISTIVLLALIIVFIALLAFGLIRRTQPVPIDEIEPELSVEDLLVSSQLADQQEAELARMEEIRHSTDSAVKEQIDKFVEEKPDAVAQLLRNWINEDWDY